MTHQMLTDYHTSDVHATAHTLAHGGRCRVAERLTTCERQSLHLMRIRSFR